jgi:DNA-binding CsgD family transcriptional regulator/tetratricopeptide (TPR) repeat protein
VELLEREAALAQLTEARAAAARGEGRVVIVVGEPGIGKTALVSEFVAGLEPGARALVGSCDDLSIPRPLGPIHDLVGTLSPALEDALAVGAAPYEIHRLLLDELALPPHPTLLVLEDVHWADEASLDVITLLARRIGTLPLLLVLTCRDGETPPGHPLHAAVAATLAHGSAYLELAPLSAEAVASLAGDGAADLYAATGGNPFYVTELLASRTADELPASVANAVRARVSRLSQDERRLVELVSVVPNRVPTSVLDAVEPGWAAMAEEPERRHLLEVHPRYVRFRHELTRNAVRSSIPIAARRQLHARILAVLLEAEADPAAIVHHAEAAGAEDVVADYALVAARLAAALDSNREAFSHYRRAAIFADRLPVRERATLHEELAAAAYAVYRLDDALEAIQRAIADWKAVGDDASVGRCTQLLSRCHWHTGDGDGARATALEAIEILEPLGESVELARAYSGLSQLKNLAEYNDQALEWGEQALDLATRLGDERTQAHVLVNLASIRVDVDPRQAPALLEAHEFAHEVGDKHEATRALANLGYALMSWGQPEPAARHARQALAYAEQNEVYNLASYIGVTLAWLQLRAGEWDEAEAITRAEIDKSLSVAQLVAKTVLTELAVRRGDEDAAERLADLAAHAVRASEPQRLAPLVELETEWALTTGAPLPLERFDVLLDEARKPAGLIGWGAVRVAAWAAVAGLPVDLDPPRFDPHAAMLRRDWEAAADAFGSVGWSYDRALMLSLLDEEEALAESLEIARELGAEPLARRAATRLRALGARIPQGPRDATRANPAGLTPRQLEVLTLLAEGLTNAEIAEQLVVSPRTAEHHVAAVMTKLGAGTRRDAARRASELGLEARR